MEKRTIRAKSQADTAAIAKTLANFLELGDAIVLVGDLAVGKTQFVKGLASALGSTDNVTSPTFTIANFYDIEKGKMLHIDTYRLDSIQHFRHLGLEEYYSECVSVLEWGDKVVEDLPAYLRIEIGFVPSDNEEERALKLSYSGDTWATRFPEVIAALSAYKSE